jgi:hypothetical protein
VPTGEAMIVVSQKVQAYSRVTVPCRNASRDPAGTPAGTSSQPEKSCQTLAPSAVTPRIWKGATLTG